MRSLFSPRRFQVTAFNVFAMVCFALGVVIIASANARAQEPLPDLPYIVVEPQSGTVFAHNRAFERWHPASLTKLMTAYVTFRAIADGEIQLGSPVTMSKNARRVPPSKMGYKEGAQLRVDTALRILIVKSANDVAVALAESVAGSEPAFVDRMNAEAQRLGLADTRFTNPNGLHDDAQYTSARDLVRLSSAVWNEFPQYRDLFETPAIRAEGKVQYAYNLLLERYPGTTGMKTGFVCASGYNIVASAERNGRRLVAVVLGASSQGERAILSARLLTEGFAASAGEPITGLKRPANPTGPKSQRARMCSEAARQARYDPLPENAVIKSQWLEERKVIRQPVDVSLGGMDAPPSDAWMARAFVPSRVPVPVRRPEYVVLDVDGNEIVPGSLRGTIPLPTPSPRVIQ